MHGSKQDIPSSTLAEERPAGCIAQDFSNGEAKLLLGDRSQIACSLAADISLAHVEDKIEARCEAVWGFRHSHHQVAAE
jgi:hypothetical protein